jgi:hypothetical protein
MISAAFSAIIIIGAYKSPETCDGITEESTILNLVIPFTLKTEKKKSK